MSSTTPLLTMFLVVTMGVREVVVQPHDERQNVSV